MRTRCRIGARSSRRGCLVSSHGLFHCYMCGAQNGDPDPYDATQTVRLRIFPATDKSPSRTFPETIRHICDNCAEGSLRISLPKPQRIRLLTQVRRATIEDQLHLLDWLERKYAKSGRRSARHHDGLADAGTAFP